MRISDWSSDVCSSDLCFELRTRRQRPVDRRLAVAREIRVGSREMPAAEEAAMRGQRRGMRGLPHPVPARVDHRALLLRVGAPAPAHQALAPPAERLADMVGEALPTLTPVSTGAA